MLAASTSSEVKVKLSVTSFLPLDQPPLFSISLIKESQNLGVTMWKRKVSGQGCLAGRVWWNEPYSFKRSFTKFIFHLFINLFFFIFIYFIYLVIYSFIHLFFYLSVFLFFYFFIFLFYFIIYLFIYLFIYLIIYSFILLFIYLFIYLFIHLFIYLFICLFVFINIYKLKIIIKCKTASNMILFKIKKVF